VWSIDRLELDRGTESWRGVAKAGRKLAFEETWNAWRSDESFRAFWIASLCEVPFDAYCWECPPVSDGNRSRPFECVFVSSPSLARMPQDPADFAEHFRPGCSVASFENLGGDAMLVAPCPEHPGDFAHLASFTATASAARQDALWRAVGEALAARIGPRPLWLSTAGHGVAWLHVRLDSSPKYYRHAAYRKA
jgi:hypothetical protein